jgi:hypothetical protein
MILLLSLVLPAIYGSCRRRHIGLTFRSGAQAHLRQRPPPKRRPAHGPSQRVRCSWLVWRWHRDGRLRPYQPFSWTWSRDDELLASIGVAPEADAVVLSFEWRRRGASEWMRACQRVPIVWTKCHLGGARPWFWCTMDAGDGRCCGRRVAKLYLHGHAFACRKCRGLVYESQSENPRYRALSKSQKIRMRLCGGPSVRDPFPEKPPRMHWRTYGRLFNKAAAAQERWIALERDYLHRHYPCVLSGPETSHVTTQRM